jgi:hypothetical protein
MAIHFKLVVLRLVRCTESPLTRTLITNALLTNAPTLFATVAVFQPPLGYAHGSYWTLTFAPALTLFPRIFPPSQEGILSCFSLSEPSASVSLSLLFFCQLIISSYLPD